MKQLSPLAICALLLTGACDSETTVPADASVLEGSVGDLGEPDAGPPPHGILGRFSALASHNGQLLASGYENKYGDLVLVSAPVTDLSKLTKRVVDGVPDVAPTKPEVSWRGGVEEEGDDVGQDTDIAVDANGVVMISYLDVTNKSLKLATRQGDKWTSHTVDKPGAASSKEVVGRYTTLALLSGKPAIAYLALNLAATTPAGTFKSELRWAQANKEKPTSASDWTISVIDSGPMACQNLCDTSTEACVVHQDGSSQCEKTGTGCASPCQSDEACVGGTCVTVLPDSKLTDIPQATGLWASAVVVSGKPLVVYYDRITGNLKGALQGGGTWKPAVIAGTAEDNVGAYCAATVDASNTVHIAFQDVSKARLKYVQVDSTTLAATVSEVIDDGQRPDGVHPVGADPAILFDSSGKPRVVYQDQKTAVLLSATRAGANGWTPKTATDDNLGRLIKSGAQSYGFYTDLALAGGKVYGSTFYYDQMAKPKGGLVFFAVE